MIQKKYYGYWCQQRDDSNTVPFFAFFARAKEIKNWVGIKRTRETIEGHQRMLRPPRTKAINYYLGSESINTIPNNILIAFDVGKAKFTVIEDDISECTDIEELKNDCGNQLKWGFIEFEYEEDVEEFDKPAFLVDGQHRLYGISSYSDENIPILTVCLLGANIEEQAFHFIVVNNKAVRVPTDNVKSIIADLDEEILEERLQKAGVKYGDKTPLLRQINDLEESPFHNNLTWDYNRERDHKILVPVTAIEQSLKYLQELFDFLEEDQDTLLELFITIWSSVSEQYEELWNKEEKFMKKVNINALNEFIGENLKSSWKNGFLEDIFNMQEVGMITKKIFKDIPDEFWISDWAIRIQDNANVREMIKKDLDQVKENIKLKRNWKDELEVVLSSESNEIEEDD